MLPFKRQDFNWHCGPALEHFSYCPSWPQTTADSVALWSWLHSWMRQAAFVQQPHLALQPQATIVSCVLLHLTFLPSSPSFSFMTTRKLLVYHCLLTDLRRKRIFLCCMYSTGERESLAVHVPCWAELTEIGSEWKCPYFIVAIWRMLSAASLGKWRSCDLRTGCALLVFVAVRTDACAQCSRHQGLVSVWISVRFFFLGRFRMAKKMESYMRSQRKQRKGSENC